MAEIPIWENDGYLVPRLSSSNRLKITPTAETLALLFDEAKVVLDAKRDGLEDWWTAGFLFLVKPRSTTKFVCQVRGTILKTSGSRAVLIASIAGHLAIREFTYGSEADEEVFLLELGFDVSSLAGRRVVIVLSIEAERQSFNDRVNIAIDTVDAIKVIPARDERKPNN